MYIALDKSSLPRGQYSRGWVHAIDMAKAINLVILRCRGRERIRLRGRVSNRIMEAQIEQRERR